jgi:hypothetical protein
MKQFVQRQEPIFRRWAPTPLATSLTHDLRPARGATRASSSRPSVRAAELSVSTTGDQAGNVPLEWFDAEKKDWC